MLRFQMAKWRYIGFKLPYLRLQSLQLERFVQNTLVEVRLTLRSPDLEPRLDIASDSAESERISSFLEQIRLGLGCRDPFLAGLHSSPPAYHPPKCRSPPGPKVWHVQENVPTN